MLPGFSSTLTDLCNWSSDHQLRTVGEVKREMAYNADYAGQQAAGGGQQAYDPNSVDPETAKAYEQAWAQYYAALGTDPNAAAAAAATAGQDVSAGGVENAIGGGR